MLIVTQIVHATDIPFATPRPGDTTPGPDPLLALAQAFAFSSLDFGTARDTSWWYGIVLGWDDDTDEETPAPGERTLDYLATKHGWSPAQVAELERLHASYQRLADLAEAARDGRLPEDMTGSLATAVYGHSSATGPELDRLTTALADYLTQGTVAQDTPTA